MDLIKLCSNFDVYRISQLILGDFLMLNPKKLVPSGEIGAKVPKIGVLLYRVRRPSDPSQMSDFGLNLH